MHIRSTARASVLDSIDAAALAWTLLEGEVVDAHAVGAPRVHRDVDAVGNRGRPSMLDDGADAVGCCMLPGSSRATIHLRPEHRRLEVDDGLEGVP